MGNLKIIAKMSNFTLTQSNDVTLIVFPVGSKQREPSWQIINPPWLNQHDRKNGGN